MLESAVEAYFVERCKAKGALVRKAKWIGVDGCPDRVVFHRGRTLWVELKRPGLAFPSNAHERQQHREHERMRAAGQQVFIINSKEGVDAFAEQL